MRTPRIYTPQRLMSSTLIELEPEPSRHLARALRIQEGDPLTLFDGHGGEYPAAVTAVDKKRVQVQVGSLLSRECESALHIHMGIALSRGDRMDWIIQKATELGVSSMTPLATERSGVKLRGERAEKKLRHWQQIAISACEQCGRNRLPLIQTLQPLVNWLEHTDAERKFVLHHRADNKPLASPVPASVALLVGPEGGLDSAEILAAEDRGFNSLRLVPRILRTETAPLAAIAILQSSWGDMTPG
jgi:16S rRNA (uracil1498-N3)-methyltransferase